METLSIKELAPYIPYNLFVIDEFGMKCRVVLDFEYSIDDRQIRPSYLLKRGYKLLLRPLSDLTKEIEVNGEKFVPIQELFQMAYESILGIDFKAITLKVKH